MKKLISAILFVLTLITSNLFLQQPLFNQIIVIGSSVFLYLSLRYPRKYFLYIFVLLYIVLAFLQVKSTRVGNVYQISGYQKYQQQDRLDQYPPHLTRLGNIVENHLETPIFTQVRQNIFDSLDFTDYFKNFFPSILFIPFLFGLYRLSKNPPRLFIISTILSLALLTVISPKGLTGPFILIPFIALLISYFPFEK